jgi:Protein of unknown function (DUF1573)
MRVFWSAIVTCSVSLGVVCPCLAEAWVVKMIPEQEYDFGAVARGADTVHRFEIKNIYKEDIKLLSVRSSCGCTSASLENEALKTGEVGYVVASFNTRTFTGIHGATLTLEVEWNDNGVRRTGEAQLRVHGNIRGDLVFQPGAVKFENVDQGSEVQKLVRVTYAGSSGWKIEDVRGTSKAFEVELIETERSGNRVAYDLLVRLKGSAEGGYFNDPLILVTNDRDNPRIPLHVSGRVVPVISVAPEPLMLGDVTHGQQVTKKLLVRGKKPFRILSVECSEGCFQFKTDEQDSERHVVEVIFSADCDPGKLKETIRIATNLGEAYDATLTAYATVLPAPAEAAGTQAAGAATSSGESVAESNLPDSESSGYRVQASKFPAPGP